MARSSGKGKGTRIFTLIIALLGFGLAAFNTYTLLYPVPLTRVYRDSNYALAAYTEAKVDFTAITTDAGNYFDLANDQYVAPKDGKYLMEGNIRYSNGMAGYPYFLVLYVNGTRTCNNVVHSAVDGIISVSVSDIRYLTKGMTVELKAYHEAAGMSGGSVYVFGSTEDMTFLSISCIGN